MGESESGSEGLGECTNEERTKAITASKVRLYSTAGMILAVGRDLEMTLMRLREIQKQVDCVADRLHEIENEERK